ncbi:MAG: SWIM zinc finger family protein [Bacteroidales bacterium]
MPEKLTLKNFETLIDPVIVERGLEYYDEGLVHELEQEAPGLWLATVEGTNKHRVSVFTQRSVIKDWECNCSYDLGPVCKHVVAVLYKIADDTLLENKQKPTEKKSAPKKPKKKRKTQQEQLSEIFRKAGKDELRAFIQKEMERDTSLRHTFLAYFADLIEEDLMPKYKRMVKNYINAASDRHGFIDYQHSYAFADNIQNLLNKAESLLSKGNFNESIIICRAVIDGLSEAIQSMDDSNGMAGGQIDQTFELLYRNFGSLSSPMMKDELFTFCVHEYSKQKNIDYELDVRFLELIPLLITDKKQEETFFSLIDQTIESVKKEIYPDWKITLLLQNKIEYLQNQKRNDEAQQVIESGMEFPEIMKMQVDDLVKNKKYGKAKNIIHEGLELAKKKNHVGTFHNWMEYLLVIAEKEKDMDSIRSHAQWLFLRNNSGYMPYYAKLKKTYPPEAWAAEAANLLNIIKGPEERGSRADLDKLADVFVAEQYWPRLLKLMQLNAQHFYFVLKYADQLPASFSSHLHELLVPGLKQLAEPTGRGKYKELARCLKAVDKLPEGEKTVAEFVDWMAETYANRPAMLEVIYGKFPKLKPQVKPRPPAQNNSFQSSIFEN